MKLTEKELNEFPIGTKITCLDVLTNKYLYLKNKYDYWSTGIYWCSNKQILEKQIQKVEIPTYTEYIPPKPVLDDEEKKYLSGVIRPWREYVTCIMKRKFETKVDSDEYISIFVSRGYNMDLPFFDAGTMYKGMELDREYSLEELGL